MSTLQRAFKDAKDAYTQAFGQVHKTPDGMFCWMGRLERAYTILADQKDDPQTKVKIEKMESLVREAYALADQKWAIYQRECVAAGKVPQEITVDCHCPTCTRQTTFRFVAAIDKSRMINGKYGGLTVDEADQFQRDADKLGVKVEWQHINLTTGEIREGRGA